MNYFFKTARPKQWTKNILVFAAPLFAFEINSYTLFNSLIYFFIFCISSSGIYFLNDVIDKRKDSLHPIKKHRPIASGKISKNNALIVSFFLILTSIVFSFIFNPLFGLIISLYCIVQIFYCTKLKGIPLIDILCICFGFVLRAISGGIYNSVGFSPWFVLSVSLISLFLIIEKRKAELKNASNKNYLTRAVLKHYSLSILQRLENIVSTSTFICYSLWAAGPDLNGAKSSWMLITIPFVLFGIFRYQLVSEQNSNPYLSKKKVNHLTAETPEEILFRDKPMQITIVLWIFSFILISQITK